ncbi:MAG: chorismate synthase [Cryomorphaceae bacterium]|jgi:chorismate synthase|nr:chorismate synthase [Cryomorphaceae bacterium]
MAGNTFGSVFRLTTWGESHGPAVGGVLDGMPAGLLLDLAAVDAALARRKPRGAAGTPRREADRVEWLSGLHPDADAQGRRRSLGTPIAFLIRNENTNPGDYAALAEVYRPGHADATYQAKYGVRDLRGGGRSSARETVARVVAGALAQQLLGPEVRVRSGVARAAGISASDPMSWDWSQLEHSAVGCPDPVASAAIEAEVARRRDAGDSAGGVVYLELLGVPAGWGEPVFDKLHALLGHALLSINAVKGVEFGDGFAGADLSGSQHNDAPDEDGVVRQNREGGITGGISNGRVITARIAFKPVSSIAQEQRALGSDGAVHSLQISGRHDALVLPRALPIVEAMAALVLADAMLQQRIQQHP